MGNINRAESGQRGSYFLVDARKRGLNLPDINPGMLASLGSDRDFFTELVLKGVINTVGLSSTTPFLPKSLRLNSVAYDLVVSKAGDISTGHIFPSIDYVPHDGDTSINPRISFAVSPEGKWTHSTVLEHDYTLPDGSTVKVRRSFSHLGVPQYEITEMNLPGHEMDFGEGIIPDYIRIIKDVSFEKTQGNHVRDCPVQYHVEAQEGDKTYSFGFVRPYPPVESKNAYVVNMHAQVRREKPKHETTAPETLLSWFVEKVDGENMVDISEDYLISQTNMSRQIGVGEKVETKIVPSDSLLYSEAVASLNRALAREHLSQPVFPKEDDAIHLSILTLGQDKLTALGIGEIEVFYYPKRGKLTINAYSLGQSLEIQDAIKIYRQTTSSCESAFSQEATEAVLKALNDLMIDPQTDKHISVRNPSRDEKKETQLKILVDRIFQDKPVPQDLLVQLEKEARQIDPYEYSYDGSLTSIPDHMRTLLLNGSKNEVVDVIARHMGPSILTKEAHKRVEDKSLAMVEPNEKKQPVRIIKLYTGTVYPEESVNEQTLSFFRSKGIILPVGEFSRWGHLICVTEDTYKEMVEKGIRAGDATVSLPFETANMIKGLIYLNNEIPYVNRIYRQKEDWSEDIVEKTEFKKLTERYLRSYIELMIDQLEKGKTKYEDADSEVFVEKRKMVDSTRKAILKLKSMKGREDDVEISDSFIYGSVMLLVLERRYRFWGEKAEKKRQAEMSIMARLEAATKDLP